MDQGCDVSIHDPKTGTASMEIDRRSRLLERIASLTPGGPLHERLCRASASILGTDSATLFLISEGGTDVQQIASSDGEPLEDFHFGLGEGPGFDAFESGEAVLAPDLANDGQLWPAFTNDAVGAGTRAALAFPLRVGAIRIGVLYLRRTVPGGLSDDALADAYTLADIATWILLEMQAGAEPGELGEGLDAEWGHRAVVHQATGIISVRLDVPLGQALVRIRATAFADSRATYEVAGEIVAGLRTIEP